MDSDTIKQFQAELKALVEKYDVTLTVDRGYYDEIDGVDFSIKASPKKYVVHYSTFSDTWSFD